MERGNDNSNFCLKAVVKKEQKKNNKMFWVYRPSRAAFSLATRASYCLTLWTVFIPIIPPPHFLLIASCRLLKLVLMDSVSLPNAETSAGRTSVTATQVAVFLWTTAPSLDLLLTMQYGMSILRQRAGKKTTSWQKKRSMHKNKTKQTKRPCTISHSKQKQNSAKHGKEAGERKTWRNAKKSGKEA